jgi:NarL family two-component system sensor histidine kinase YdfH
MAEAIIALPPRRRAVAVAWYDILCCLVIIAVHLQNNVVQNIVLLLLGVLPLLCVLGYVTLYQRQLAARERTQALLHELEVAHAELAAYADRVEDLTLLTERQRMARELHDTLAQGLAGTILQLDAARLRLAGGETERAGEIIDQARDRACTALAAARQAIDELRAAPAGAFDVQARVETEIRRFSTTTGTAVEADIADLATLPADLAEQAMRVITEGPTSVVRHTQAHRVWIRVTSRESELESIVRDNGVGFDVTAVAGLPGHYGLLGLRERARLAGGELEVRSGPGQGTTLRLTLPRVGTSARPGPAAVAPRRGSA